MITVTSQAAEKIKGIKTAQATPEEAGLRVRVVGGGCSGFQLKNPNAKSGCGCGGSFTA